MEQNISSTGKATQKNTRRGTTTGKAGSAFTKEERAAIKEAVQEFKTEQRRVKGGEEVDVESEVLAKIAEMPEPDRKMAERVHAIIRANVPGLSPRLWYGMPAYSKDGKVICFFQPAGKFKTRYSTFGFSDKAHLDDGEMWPNSYALMQLTSAEEARIIELVKKAVS
jgi:uncharacterized protein YdhG (YjbR/CyaY superfamily)